MYHRVVMMVLIKHWLLYHLFDIQTSRLWICIYHLCPNRKWFYNLDELDGGLMYMGNDQTCELLGIGEIMIENSLFFWLKFSMYCTWRSVSSKWVLSEFNGFKIITENGTLKVISGALAVMGLTCQNNLYFLKGSTFIGGAATVADKIGEFASGTSRIWDMLVRCFARPMKGHRELQIRFYALIAYNIVLLYGEKAFLNKHLISDKKKIVD